MARGGYDEMVDDHKIHCGEEGWMQARVYRCLNCKLFFAHIRDMGDPVAQPRCCAFCGERYDD